MVQFDKSKTAVLAERIDRLLQRQAGDGMTMEYWLFEQFPKGMEQLAEHYERQAKPFQQSVGNLTDRPEFCDMSFDHPMFDQEYTNVQKICKGDGYGVRIEAFDALESKKNQHDKIIRELVFFEQELFPRLRELKGGAPVDRNDIELFRQAKEYAQPLAAQYNQNVDDEYKPRTGSYGAFRQLLDDMLQVLQNSVLSCDKGNSDTDRRR
jgi:hypothetical protein